jgi:hypothetical protein
MSSDIPEEKKSPPTEEKKEERPAGIRKLKRQLSAIKNLLEKNTDNEQVTNSLIHDKTECMEKIRTHKKAKRERAKRHREERAKSYSFSVNLTSANMYDRSEHLTFILQESVVLMFSVMITMVLFGIAFHMATYRITNWCEFGICSTSVLLMFGMFYLVRNRIDNIVFHLEEIM